MAKDSSLWSIDTSVSSPSWSMLMDPGSPTNPEARQSFATAMIRGNLVSIGGQGNEDLPLAQVLLLDTCKTGGCGVGPDVSCNLQDARRGECKDCSDDVMCCREATIPRFTGGLCSGVDIKLASCSVDTSIWRSLMAYMVPSLVGPESTPYVSFSSPKLTFGDSVSECRDAVHSMCREASAIGSVKSTPLLCSQEFTCASLSPFMSSLVDGKGLCNVGNTTCPKSGPPNNVICCSYMQFLVNASCDGLDEQQISGLAMSKFSECSQSPNCIAPPHFQITQVQTATSTRPTALQMAASAAVRTSLYVFGGFSAEGSFLDTFWELDRGQYPPTWVDLSASRGKPSGGRRGAAMATILRTLVLFGGEGSAFLYDEAFLFDTDSAQWMDITYTSQGDKPSARYLHAMVGVGATKAYLFGGETILGKSAELFGKETQSYLCVCASYVLYMYVFI
jgi:hypothetical protein